MQVKALRTVEEFHRCANFSEEVYRNHPHWVPQDVQHLVKLLGGETASGLYSRIQAFWVEDGDQILGTVTAVIDERYNQHWNERTGHLLLFEALPDQEAAVNLLIRSACDWLREQGSQAARWAMLIGWQIPLTIDAYEELPTFLHTYNPAYYHSYIKDAGFVTERGAVQYQVQFTTELASRYQQMVERAVQSGVRLRPMDFDHLEKETALLTELFNETFAQHWGMNPITEQVMHELTVELKDFLVPDFSWFAEADGQTVGFVYSLPDLNQALHRLRGREIAEYFPEFQQALAEINHGILLTIGVKRSHRGRGINLALAASSYLAMIERGYQTGSYTIVLDDNWPSRRTAEKLGCRVTRNFNIYHKEFGGLPQREV